MKVMSPSELGYLPNIARLELAVRRVYHAADAVPLPAKILQDFPTGRLMSARPKLAPAHALLRSHWPVHAIWLANTRADAPKPEMRAQDVLITRPDFDPVLTCLPVGGGAFIAGLQAGQSFDGALGAARAEAAGFDLSATLAVFVSGGAIVGIDEGGNQ